MQRDMDAILRKHLVPASDFIYGYADLTGLVEEEFGDFSYGISIGKKLDVRIVDSIIDGPTMEYYAHYRTMNSDLTALSVAISEDMDKQGFEIKIVEPSVTIDHLPYRNPGRVQKNQKQFKPFRADNIG